jgi:hypothetical protein
LRSQIRELNSQFKITPKHQKPAAQVPFIAPAYSSGSFVIALVPKSLPPRALVVGLTNHGENLDDTTPLYSSSENRHHFTLVQYV